ncbi:MAG: alpha-galactosidase [Lentisphaeria bacterium]|nr:alpha-galactosidase [Lentisphaeria bacterium]
MSIFTLTDGKFAVMVQPDGVYSIKGGKVELNNCRPQLVINEAEVDLSAFEVVESGVDELKLKSENEFGQWFLIFKTAEINGSKALKINFSGVANSFFHDVRLSALYSEDLQVKHLLLQGDTMGGCESILLTPERKASFTGFQQLMLSDGDDFLRLSFPLVQKLQTSFNGSVEKGEVKGFSAGSNTMNQNVLALEAEDLTICYGNNGFNMMKAYAVENKTVEKDFDHLIARGWNTWDYYRWTITEDEVLSNAEFIARDPVLSKYIKRIIIDDGWQYCYGEWEANSLFPHGMEYLATKITEMGFDPGLWIAPIAVEPHARMAQLDSDMMAMAECGKPTLCFECMRRYGFVLDPTNPKTRKYLYDLFDLYSNRGYKYFKLDFMGQVLRAKKFFNDKISRSQMQALIMEPIRQATQGRATILGCNYLFEAGDKYVDAVRIGGDIHALWGSIVENTTSVANRFWANRQLWINDPDFALARGIQTSNDPDLNRLTPSWVFLKPEEKVMPEGVDFTLAKMTRNEAELLLSIVVSSGGALNLSDNLPRLNAVGLDLARRAVSAEFGEAALPLDLFTSEQPAYYLQKVGKAHRLLMINWGETAKEMGVDLNKFDLPSSNIVNFWNDEPVKAVNGRLAAEIQPHSCLFVTVK